ALLHRHRPQPLAGVEVVEVQQRLVIAQPGAGGGAAGTGANSEAQRDGIGRALQPAQAPPGPPVVQRQLALPAEPPGNHAGPPPCRPAGRPAGRRAAGPRGARAPPVCVSPPPPPLPPPSFRGPPAGGNAAPPPPTPPQPRRAALGPAGGVPASRAPTGWARHV